MISLITKILILVQLAAAALLFALAVRVGHIDNLWLAGILGAAPVVLVRLLISANNFFLAWWYHSDTPEKCRLEWRERCSLFRNEFRASMLTSSWTMPFHSFTKRAAKNPTGLPVLLVHGYGANSGFWHGLSKALAQAHITHHALDLEPVFGAIDAYVPSVHQAMQTLCQETGHDQIVVVAHSMGGLVMRTYLQVHGSAQIAKIITLGTPHHGTALARFAMGRNSCQMSWIGSAQNGAPSAWMRELAAKENTADYALFVSIYSHHDNIVAPQTSAHLPGARNIALCGIGHVALAFDATIQAHVIEEIRHPIA